MLIDELVVYLFVCLLAIFRSPVLAKVFIWITLLGKLRVILIFSVFDAPIDNLKEKISIFVKKVKNEVL